MALKLEGTPLGDYLAEIYRGKQPMEIQDWLNIPSRQEVSHQERMAALKAAYDAYREEGETLTEALTRIAVAMLKEGYAPHSDGYPWRI